MIDWNNVEEIFRLFGGITELARAVGVPIPTVQGWIVHKKIPSWRQSAIERAAEKRNIKLPTMKG